MVLILFGSDHKKFQLRWNPKDSTITIFATTKEEYATQLKNIFDEFDNGNGWLEMRENARNYANQHFNCSIFNQQFAQCFKFVC